MPSEYAARHMALLEDVVSSHVTMLRLHGTYLVYVRESLDRLDMLAAQERRSALSRRVHAARERASAPPTTPVPPAPAMVHAGDIDRECDTQLWVLPETAAMSCPIDMAPFRPGDRVTRIRGCGHRFNAASLERALQERPTCPMCRYDITCTRIRAHSVV